MNWTPIILSFKLAGVTALLLLLIAIPICAWLFRSKTFLRPVIEALITMPLVLPPTVLGFYLLLAFSPANTFGAWIEQYVGISLVFSFEGLVIASMIYSLPFMVYPIYTGLQGIPQSVLDAAKLTGKSRFKVFTTVLLPSIKPSIISAIIITFAHTIGEFGVVLMLGGNVPGVTRVASIALYDEVESLNYADAHMYALVLIGITFILLLTLFGLRQNKTIVHV